MTLNEDGYTVGSAVVEYNNVLDKIYDLKSKSSELIDIIKNLFETELKELGFENFNLTISESKLSILFKDGNFESWMIINVLEIVPRAGRIIVDKSDSYQLRIEWDI